MCQRLEPQQQSCPDYLPDTALVYPFDREVCRLYVDRLNCCLIDSGPCPWAGEPPGEGKP